jgi:diguanylate cyclase (GGDEF)-like protein
MAAPPPTQARPHDRKAPAEGVAPPADPPSSAAPPPGEDLSGPAWRATFWESTSILLSAVTLLWMLRLALVPETNRPDWMLQMVLVLGAMLASSWGALQRSKLWTTPLSRLTAMLPDVREGRRPIEDLSNVQGGVAPVVPMIQELLRDLRRQRAATAELEAEISQRVASRTDALERAIGSLRHQATRDPLTGLFNRRFLDQFLPQAVQRHAADKGRGDLCLLMIDVDYFKVLNDTLGHAAGDELLKTVGQLIRSSIRGEDVAFRCGGDEFVILLPGCTTEGGRAMANRLTSLVDALAKTLHVPKRPRLSIGLSTLSQLDAPSPERLLQEADRSLYEVKAARHAGDRAPHAAAGAVAAVPHPKAVA